MEDRAGAWDVFCKPGEREEGAVAAAPDYRFVLGYSNNPSEFGFVPQTRILLILTSVVASLTAFDWLTLARLPFRTI